MINNTTQLKRKHDRTTPFATTCVLMLQVVQQMENKIQPKKLFPKHDNRLLLVRR